MIQDIVSQTYSEKFESIRAKLKVSFYLLTPRVLPAVYIKNGWRHGKELEGYFSECQKVLISVETAVGVGEIMFS